MSTLQDADVVSIVVGSQTLSGWQDVRISRTIEGCPSSFDLALTERYPTQDTEIVIKPGDPCRVTIGDDVIATGYVDRYSATISPESHDVRITGRGLCQDIVDCSAMFATYQLNNYTIVSLAKKLCAPFGISVTAPDGDSVTGQQFNVTLTETPYEIIERVARWANFLPYEGTDGGLILARVGDTKMASGFAQGQNVERASVSLSTDNRYTEMHGIYLSTGFLIDAPPEDGSPAPLPSIKGADAVDKTFPARADGSPRYRPLLIVSEQSQNLPGLAAERVKWDMARRVGRSQQVNLTCDSWRDQAGTLWAPNSLAVVNLPALKLANLTWLISAVTFSRSETGTTAEVTLMPKEAFVPAYEVLQAFDWQIAQDLGGASNGAPAAR